LDAVIDEVDGILVPMHDVHALASALARILHDSDLAQRFGDAGRRRMLRDFRQDTFWRGLAAAYVKLLHHRGLDSPALSAESPQRPLGSVTARARTKRPLKSLTDFCLAAILLLALFPLIAVVALLVCLTMGAPILFRQKRAGLNGKIFSLLKFRTMCEARDSFGALLPDEQRLSSLGKFLRQYSLDELPQLWDVLIGNMSFVGPRPLLADYLPRYSSEQARRHTVKPGITGWAQVNGRNSLAWDEKFQLDLWYVDNASFGLDAKIIGRTIKSMFQRAGIVQDGCATMPEFMGNAAGASSANDHARRECAENLRLRR
jgi:lipopolysaccharide/colanic/teichoic acid biosynthesis glycosyltransferase